MRRAKAGRTPVANILLVDGEIAVRKLLSQALAAESRLEVVAVAATLAGADAALLAKPISLVVLGLEVDPDRVLDFLRKLRSKHPRLPVIAHVPATREGARLGIEAMASGASEALAKPSAKNAEDWVEHANQRLLPMIMSVCLGSCASVPKRRSQDRSLRVAPKASRSKVLPIRALGIAVSTGGPDALTRVFEHLPADLGVPVLVVQHMPPKFTAQLAQRLDSISPLSVGEGYAGAPVTPGRAWIAPGGSHMVLREKGSLVEIALTDEATEHGVRPAANPLLRSLVSIYGASTLAVVMTGMGSDGLEGCRQLHEAGGRIFAQDQESSVVWGMPGVVAREGLAERIIPLDQMAQVITQCIKESRAPARRRREA